MAGQCLDPQMAGVLVFIGGCNKNLEALNDMYFMHTGIFIHLLLLFTFGNAFSIDLIVYH